MKRSCALLWLASLGALGCGVQPVELAPLAGESAPLDAKDILVGDDISEAVLKRLHSDASDGDAAALSLLYPSPPALIVPANLAPITFEWSDKKPGPAMPMKPKAGDPMAMMMPPMQMMMPGMMMPGMMPGPAEAVVAYELSLRSGRSTLRIFTSMLNYAVPVDRWRELLRESVDGTLEVKLRALRANDTIASAEPLELTVWDDTLKGTLYTWSTTAQGLSAAGLESTHEQNLKPPSPLASSGAGRCVGCHAVSHDGKRLLAAIGGKPALASWPLGSGAPLEHSFDDAAAGGYVYGSFDPLAARIAVTEAGRLSILDADTGQVLETSAWPMATTYDYPTWSPDGRWIALVVSPGKPMKDAAGGGALARVAVKVDGSLGEPQMLVMGMPDEAFFAPSYSPQGDFLAFEKRKGMGKNPREGTLWIVAADGGMPIELAAASERMPRAGASSPAFIQTGVPGRAFIVFASQRPVGSFVPQEGQRQLFAAALDLQLAAAGMDPSSPAFWLPFQQRTSSYLRAQWAMATTACSPSPEVCDGADDDCNGVVDDDCCAPKTDTCGDGLDQDCDGTSDEGCGCEYREVCANQIDDDCDLRTDEEPCAPAK